MDIRPLPRSRSGSNGQDSRHSSRPHSRSGSRSRSASPVFAVEELEFPNATHLNDTTRKRNWSIKELEIPSIIVATDTTMAVPMFINTGVKKHVPDSPFVATDGKGFAGDIQLWEPGENLLQYCSQSLAQACKGDELYKYIQEDGLDFPFERRYGAVTYAVRICGLSDEMSQFAGVISWNEENLAQANYDEEESTFKTSKDVSNNRPIRNFKNRMRKAIAPLKKGKFFDGWLTMIGKESFIEPPFNDRFEEYLFREGMVLQKEMGKKNENFYHLRLIGVNPGYSNPDYKVEEMILTWFCYNADRAGVSCLHVLTDPNMLKSFTDNGFTATAESVRLRNGAKLNLPLLIRKPIIADPETVGPDDLRETLYPYPLWKEHPAPASVRIQRETLEAALPAPLPPQAYLPEDNNRFSLTGNIDRAMEELKNKRLDIFEDVDQDSTQLQGTPPRPPSNATGSLRENKRSPNLPHQDRVADIGISQSTSIAFEEGRPSIQMQLAARHAPSLSVGSIADTAEVLTYRDPKSFLNENREDFYTPTRRPSQRSNTIHGRPDSTSPCFMWRSNVPEHERNETLQRYPSDRASTDGRVLPLNTGAQFPQGSIGRARSHFYSSTQRRSPPPNFRPQRGLGSLKTDNQGRPDFAHYRSQNIAEVLNPSQPQGKLRYKEGRGSYGNPLRMAENDYGSLTKRPDTPMPDPVPGLAVDGPSDAQRQKGISVPERALLSPITAMSPPPMSEAIPAAQTITPTLASGPTETSIETPPPTTPAPVADTSRIPKLRTQASRTSVTGGQGVGQQLSNDSTATLTRQKTAATMIRVKSAQPVGKSEEDGEVVYHPPSSLAKRKTEKRKSLASIIGDKAV